MPGKVPERWEAYEPMGEQIPGTRFISFKVPLYENMCRRMPDKEKFTVAHLMDHMENTNQELGLVIDLTNTSRYYNYEDIEKHDIQYHKVFCPGKVIPPKNVRAEFFQVVDDFLEENSDNDKLIGVHCTHGLNRSGHLVCRYMIDRLNMSPEDAINLFNEARGYDMEREHYIEDLRSGKSHEAIGFVEPDNPPGTQVNHHQARGSSGSSRQQNTSNRRGHFKRDRNNPNDSGYGRVPAQYNNRHSDTQGNSRGRGRHQSYHNSNGSSHGPYGRSNSENFRRPGGAGSSYGQFGRSHGRSHQSEGGYGQFGRSHQSEGGYGQFGRSHQSEGGYGQLGWSHQSEGAYGQFGRSHQSEGGYGQLGWSHQSEGGYGQYDRLDQSEDSEEWTTVRSRKRQRDRDAPHPYRKRSRHGP